MFCNGKLNIIKNIKDNYENDILLFTLKEIYDFKVSLFTNRLLGDIPKTIIIGPSLDLDALTIPKEYQKFIYVINDLTLDELIDKLNNSYLKLSEVVIVEYEQLIKKEIGIFSQNKEKKNYMIKKFCNETGVSFVSFDRTGGRHRSEQADLILSIIEFNSTKTKFKFDVIFDKLNYFKATKITYNLVS